MGKIKNNFVRILGKETISTADALFIINHLLFGLLDDSDRTDFIAELSFSLSNHHSFTIGTYTDIQSMEQLIKKIEIRYQVNMKEMEKF